MGWAARLNTVAQSAKDGALPAKPRAARPISALEDDFLNRWNTMWERVHGIRVDISPRTNPIIRQVA